MTTYTEEQLLKAVYYACSMQKAEDYQTAGNILIGSDNHEASVEKLLNNLCNSDDNCHKEITIEDIDEYLKEDKEETELPWKDIK